MAAGAGELFLGDRAGDIVLKTGIPKKLKNTAMTAKQPLHHGGRLAEAAKHWGIPQEQWLDLSTGINPQGWPLPAIPESFWRRLPDDNDGLESIIKRWSGAPENAGCTAIPGTQAVIQALPRLRAPSRVGILSPAYEEHARCWSSAGHDVVAIDANTANENDEWLNDLDVVVWINPNNPTGHQWSRQQLWRWHQSLKERNGWLIVDEAFLFPDDKSRSLATIAPERGLVVLKSLGKFFGLAGVRAGAVIGDPSIAAELENHLGPWALSGPARFIMKQALADRDWQVATAAQVRRSAARLEELLASHGLPAPCGTPLFRYVPSDNARAIADDLAREGIFVRHFTHPAAVRFGLPGEEEQWQRLDRALTRVMGRSLNLTSPNQE